MTPAPSAEQVRRALKDVDAGSATYKTADLLRAHIAALENERDAIKAQIDAGVRIQAEVTRDATRMARERDAALADNAEFRARVRGWAVHLQMSIDCGDVEMPVASAIEIRKRTGELKTECGQPHPGAALLDELETLRGQRALFDEAAAALYGYTEFAGPCAHGRDPWDRCDECGEGTSVAAAQKVIVKMTEERGKTLAWALRWKRAAKSEREDHVHWEQRAFESASQIGDINTWIRFTYDATWMYPNPESLVPRLKQLVADRETMALTEADQRILTTAQPPDFLREHHPERREYEAAMSGYSVGVNHALDTIRRMIKVKKAIKPL